MQIDQYRTEQFADEADRAAYMRMIVREAYRYQDEREKLRRRETDILAAVAILANPSDHVRQVAAMIREHRAAGNYTTMHR